MTGRPEQNRPAPEAGCDYCGRTGCDADCDEAFAAADGPQTDRKEQK